MVRNGSRRWAQFKSCHPVIAYQLRDLRFGPRETILIAEDEELVRKVTVQILERAGYRVLAAPNGHEAVKLLKAHLNSIDLAILDVVMPELSGPETYTRLLELRPGLPVLFSSGYTDSARFETRVPSEQKLRAKPYRSEDLLRQVRAALAKNWVHSERVLV